MEKKRKPPNLRSFVVQTLRRASFRWYARSEAMKAARVSRGTYVCEMCGPTVEHNVKEIQLDHKQAVIDPEKGFTTWDDFINRLFVDVTGWRVLCRKHHDKVTEAQDVIRKQTRIAQNLEKLKKKSNN